MGCCRGGESRVSRVWNEWEHGVSLPAEIECSGSRDSVSAGFFFFKKKRREFFEYT